MNSNIEILAAIYWRRRHAGSNPQASTQVCNTLRLTYAHSHGGSASLWSDILQYIVCDLNTYVTLFIENNLLHSLRSGKL